MILAMQNLGGMNGVSNTRLQGLQGLGLIPAGFSVGSTCGDGIVPSHIIKFYDGSSLCVPDATLASLYGSDALSSPPANTASGQAAATAAFTALAVEQQKRSLTLPVGYQITRACFPGVQGSIGGQTGYWSVHGPDGNSQCMSEAQLDAFAPGSAAGTAAAQQGFFTGTGPVAAQAPAQVAAANIAAANQSVQYAASLPPSMLTAAQQQDPAILAAQAQMQAQQAAFQAQEQAAAQQYSAQLQAQQVGMQQAIAAYQQANPAAAQAGNPVSQATIDAANAAAAQQIAAAQAVVAQQVQAQQQAATATTTASQLAAAAAGIPPVTSTTPLVTSATGAFDPMAWVTANPMIALGGAAVVLFFLMGKR